jgi:hypothetical protein
MKNFFIVSFSIFSLGISLNALAEDQPYFYCPSSIICDTTTCKPTSGQDLWDNNTTLPPGTKAGEYKFVHAEWNAGEPNKSTCNYYDTTEYGIYIKAKTQLWPQTFAQNAAWWPQIDSFALCYPSDLGNSSRCPFTKAPPWEPPSHMKK